MVNRCPIRNFRECGNTLLSEQQRPGTALIGIGLSALCLAVFGRNDFLFPAMSGILSLLLLLRHPLEKAGYAN